ncbi:MAG TPA: hypothetical protein VML36_02345 [Nitrospiria bacterium]|nr:hypothetical protein [Nitrospiria bacterium]
MAQPVPHHHSLRRLFRTLTERSFLERLGWPDWGIVGYVSDLLTNCVHADQFYPLQETTGRRLVNLTEMLQEAEVCAQNSPPERERDVHRHIGDYTLVMMGLFPEGVHGGRTLVIGRPDALLDYVKVGKRAYRMAAETTEESTVDPAARRSLASLFRQLSVKFEVCVLGLGYVRQELDEMGASHDPRLRRLSPN